MKDISIVHHAAIFFSVITLSNFLFAQSALAFAAFAAAAGFYAFVAHLEREKNSAAAALEKKIEDLAANLKDLELVTRLKR